MDVSTFKKLKGSRQYHPVTTEVIYDWEQIAELSLNAVGISEKGFDSVWDAQFLSFLLKNFKEGFSIGRERMKTKGIKSRFVIEFTRENIDSFDLYDFGEIRHLDGIKGNFGIMDSRCYMVYVLLTNNYHDQPPASAVFSNLKPLVEKQQKLFDELWKMGISLPARIKELENIDLLDKTHKITNPDEIKDELYYLVEQSRKELLIFSSTSILNQVVLKDKSNIFAYLSNLLKKDTKIKILLDNFNAKLVQNIYMINNTIKSSKIKIGYTNKLGNFFDEMVILSDGKYMLRIKYDKQGQLEASYSKEMHQIFIQEILFEKYWNEIGILKAATNLNSK
jgi:hypothetical protein